MFEDKTYENILSGMLDRVSINLDRRQGSIIYDALAPAAAELAQVYINLNTILNNAYADTAVEEDFDKKASEIGLTRIQANGTIQKGVFTGNGGIAFDVELGTRFSIPNAQINFITIEKISNGVFKMQCETAGIVGNTVSGQLIPIDYIDGLETANLTEILIIGENIETDDNFRARYFNKVQNVAQDGNKSQYIEWAAEFSGIGRAKVIPKWNGANTIKVSILDANNDLASTPLVTSFQQYLDPNSQGLGEGKAPIGAIVTVSTATNKNISVSATIVVANGYTLSQAQASAQTAIELYFRNEISYKKNVISIFTVGARLDDLSEIDSISNIKLNNGTVDITLNDEEIPHLNSITLT